MKLNLNAVQSNVRVSDHVVTVTSIGLKLANQQAAAVLSHGWPVHTGPEPMPRKRVDLPMAKGYGDPIPTRAGRSVRPAGCPSRLGLTARPAVLNRRSAFSGSAAKRQATRAR